MNRATLVAELGINHQGDFGILCEMANTFLVHADYVKTQIRSPRLCIPEDQWDKPKFWNGEWMTYIEYKELMEFSREQYDEFDKIYRGEWFPSVWDLESLRFIAPYDLPFIKIPSAKITDLELVEEASKQWIPIVLSTGMSNRHQIAMAVEIAMNYNNDVTVLHCTSTYPVVDDEVNLNAIQTFREKFRPRPHHVGFSSHSPSPYPAIYSALLGAEFIEVHATLDRTWPGSDHAASIEGKGFELIARELGKIPRLLGDGNLVVYESELEPMRKLRGNL
jgi:N-acetylneuraminate synthase